MSDLMSKIQDPKIDFEDCKDCYARPRNPITNRTASFDEGTNGACCEIVEK